MTSRLDDLLDLSLQSAFDPSGDLPEEIEPMPERIGRYAVRKLLGHGGLGVVYLARDEELGRDVAIKVLHLRHGGDEALLNEFRAEARTCSQLQHPSIVPVHEFGTTENGRVYYTMRVVAGETLRQLLTDSRADPGDRPRFLTILERAAQAVAFAHSHDVVHGDLTPANVMVGEFGEVQVLDWGLSRRAGPTEVPATSAGRHAIGTPAYMAPEQAQGRSGLIDRRTDVFGLGAILCEILTGKPPYVGTSVFQVHERAATGAIDEAMARLDAMAGERDLAALARACLQPDPTRRPADAAAIARALSQHLQEIETRAHRFELEAAEQRASAAAERRARRATTILATFVVLAVAITSGTWLWWHGEREQRRTHANQRAVAALTTARQLQAKAHDEAELRAALAAVAACDEAVAAPDVDPSHVSASVELREELSAALTTASHDAETRELLAERRWHVGDDRPPAEIEADYRDSFARCGLDVDAPDRGRTAAALRSHRLQMELSAALHWWALQRRRTRLPAADSWQPLLELADRCDPDPRRTDLRRAFLDGDTAHLRELAAAAATVELLPGTIALLGQLLIAVDDREAAIDLYRRGHLSHPDDYALCHDLATLLAQESSPPLTEVTELMKVGVALRPDSPHALVDLALCLIQEGRLDAARPLAARALAIDPEYGRSWYCTSRLRELDGDLEGALAATREYVLLEPPGAGPWLQLSRLLERTGRGDEALEACRRAVAARPRWGDALFTLGRLLFERMRLVEAIDVLEDAVPVARERAPTLLMLGMAMNTAKLHRDAVPVLRRANELMPDDVKAEFFLAVALARTGELDEAERRLLRTRELSQVEDEVAAAVPHFLQMVRSMRGQEAVLASFVTDDTTAVADPVLLGDLALARHEDLAATALFAAACAEHPEKEPLVADRWARAAARMAFLPHSPPFDDRTRARCAARSLQLLQSAVQTAVQSATTPGPQQPMATLELQKNLSTWTLAPELAPTREPEALDWLPAEQRDGWRELWATIDRARAR